MLFFSRIRCAKCAGDSGDIILALASYTIRFLLNLGVRQSCTRESGHFSHGFPSPNTAFAGQFHSRLHQSEPERGAFG